MEGASLPIVDRVGEIDRLRVALDAAALGEGSLLFVSGEAGIGKTRLVEELVSEARLRGFAAGMGTALPESVAPYHPWHELHRGWTSTTPCATSRLRG